MISHANEASLHRMDTQESVTFNTLTKLARTLFGTATTRKTQPAASRFRPRLECLEERAVPAVYNVTNGNDAGVGSLRAAITAANATFGVHDEIHIDSNLTISLMSELPAISDDVFIVGGGQSNTVIRRAAAAPAFRIFTIDSTTDAHI
jgi:hypothetical protein